MEYGAVRKFSLELSGTPIMFFLTIYALVSNYKFHFRVTIHFLQTKWLEGINISREFNLSDHVLNSHDLTN